LTKKKKEDKELEETLEELLLGKIEMSC